MIICAYLQVIMLILFVLFFAAEHTKNVYEIFLLRIHMQVVRFLTQAVVALCLCVAVPLYAVASQLCDFDGDGLAEFPVVTVNEQGNYTWLALNPRTNMQRVVMTNFGNASTKLIPGNWFESGRAVAAVVFPITATSPLVRAIWSAASVDYLGGRSMARNLGRSGDLIIHGGDYDGNGITDSLILKQTTGKLGLRVNYFLSNYNGNNLGKERLYKSLGSPFRDGNFFFSPDGVQDYLAVLRRGNSVNTILQLKPFTDNPQAFKLSAIPGGSLDPLPLKQGSGKADLLLFYARRSDHTLVVVKTIQGTTVFSALVAGTGLVSVGDYLPGAGWEFAVQDGTEVTIINPHTKVNRRIQLPAGKLVSCISRQYIQ